MKRLLVLSVVILSLTSILYSGTFDITYTKFGPNKGHIRKVWEKPPGRSKLPLKESRRITQSTVQITNVPANLKAADLLKMKLDLSVLASCTYNFKKKTKLQNPTEDQKGPNGKQLNFNSVKHQSGLIVNK